jgi:anthranilate synthase component I
MTVPVPAGDAGFATFRANARGGGLVPVWRDVLLDTVTPVAAFSALAEGPFRFLLESAPAGSDTWSRWTYIGTAPRAAWRLAGGAVSVWAPETGWRDIGRPDDPLAALETWVGQRRPVADPALGDLWGGAVGYLGYDLVRAIERLPEPGRPALAVPDALFVKPRVVVALDNLRGDARCIAAVEVPDGATDATLDRLYADAVADLDATVRRLRQAPPLPPLEVPPDASPATGESSLSQSAFEAGVARMLEYIRAGDVFQVLLARTIRVPHDFDTLVLYRMLRSLNPSPYQFLVDFDGTTLVGSSPELLVRVADSTVTVRPIAGTRPRGQSVTEDAERAAELAADPKEAAEHVMLVDLGRNDVGRVAEYGSVAVPQFRQVERYSHVLHLVSEVTGRLRAGIGAFDAFRAVFPAGTMTGAPKIRAMEIIDELEPVRRGPYAGAVGWIGGGGDRMDLAITIRTAVLHGGTATVTAGAGIVADSVPALEWAETEHKARAMLTAIGRARGARIAGC